MSSFVHPMLLWGLLIVGVPVLIHLINMLRHRRVQWAAMEFLLVSQKKHRTWIVLKQLLLLLMRMAAVAAVVLLVAQPLLRNELGNLFGSAETHHIVLLDDSFSMSDRWKDTSAFGEAKRVVEQIGAEAARQRQPQAFTLLRFSRVGRLDRRTQPDLLAEPVTTGFADRLGEVLAEIAASQTSASPIQALSAIDHLLGDSDGARRIVYLVSDFRAGQWDDPRDLKKQLLQLGQAGAEVQLVHCVDRARPNLAVAALSPLPGVRAAGVPLSMEVSVQNFGTEPAKNVSVMIEEDGHSRGGLTIAEIPPGAVVKERFPVRFPLGGEHLTTVRLPSDAVGDDNVRYAAIELPVELPVLIIDGSPDARDARYLSVATAPGRPVRTGMKPQIETPRYLSLKPLDEFQVIDLVNFERLDRSAIEALQQYVAAGGGLAVFLGERCRSKFINDELYRGGEGLFPLPLAGPEDLLIDRLRPGPDLEVEDHFMFRFFAGRRNSFLDTVIVQRYFAAAQGWEPEPDSTTEVIARLRNGAPLAVERRYGEGRVIAVLTTAAPVWNNWARNPSFVIALQDMQAYLAGPPSRQVSHPLGSKLQVKLSAEVYRKQVRFISPGDTPAPAAPVDALSTEDGSLLAEFAQTDRSGIYEAQLTRNDGTVETRRYALNVEAEEGDLETLSELDLAERLDGVAYRYNQAAEFHYTVTEEAGYNIGTWLLYLLVTLLIVEQIVAWWASYHPPARAGHAAGKGGGR